MVELKASDLRIMHEYGRGFSISVRLEDTDVVGAVEAFKKEVGEYPIRCELKKWTERRSLSANAYFHVLVGKIAAKMKLGEDEVKRDMVLNYGTQMRNEDGSPVGLKLPEGTAPERLGVKYAKWFDQREENGKPFDCFIVFEETHRYDTAQMSRLIDGTVRECKELGIETLTPADLERMLNEWK